MKKILLFAIPLLTLMSFTRPVPVAGLLSKLQQNDTLTLQFSSGGCFHSYASRMLFIRKKEGIEVVRFATRNMMAKQRNVPDSVISRKLMSGEDLTAFTGFEQGLRKPKGDGCTTRESYSVTSRYDSIAVNDASCQWNGFGKLTIAIFGE